MTRKLAYLVAVMTMLFLASIVYASGQADYTGAAQTAVAQAGDPVTDVSTLKSLADLGIPVVTTLAIVWAYIMWRAYQKQTERYTSYLEGQIILERRAAGLPADSTDPGRQARPVQGATT